MNAGTDSNKKELDFRNRLGELFQNQNLATLATHQAGQPYASLVAFVASEDFKHIYFATPNTTRKYSNLQAESRVAMLINSSTNRESDFHRAISVTAVGKATELKDEEKITMQAHYLAKHPHLIDFVNSPTCALIDVSVATYYMVRKFQNVTELHLNP